MATYKPPYNSVTDSLNFSRFASLCTYAARHFNEGWDNGNNYNIRYFEIWNEPGGAFWYGTNLQYYHMFQTVADSLKTYNPEIKVGGPGAVPSTSYGIHTEFREDLIRYLANHNVPFDFYSWHVYGLKNPFKLKYLADTIRNLLDESGYSEAESHITEINAQLDSSLYTLLPSPLGAAYFASLTLTAQLSPVDLLLWYPYNAFYSQSANAIKSFHQMQLNTPLIVASSGNETVGGDIDIDTTNFMILAAKSNQEDKLYMIISNYNSNNQDYHIELNNLLWADSEIVVIRKNYIKDTLNYYLESDTISASSQLVLDIPDMSAPSFLFIRLEKLSNSSIFTQNTNENISIYPNPFSEIAYIDYDCPETGYTEICIYNLIGEKIETIFLGNLSKGEHKFVWNITNNSKITKGVYLCNIKTQEKEIVKKIIIE